MISSSRLARKTVGAIAPHFERHQQRRCYQGLRNRKVWRDWTPLTAQCTLTKLGLGAACQCSNRASTLTWKTKAKPAFIRGQSSETSAVGVHVDTSCEMFAIMAKGVGGTVSLGGETVWHTASKHKVFQRTECCVI